MSIEKSHAVDGLGVSRLDGKIILIISDHLAWRDTQQHFDLLEKKVNAYLSFVASGQLYEVLPDARDKGIRIELIHEHAPDEKAIEFLTAIKEQLNSIGLEFMATTLPEGY